MSTSVIKDKLKLLSSKASRRAKQRSQNTLRALKMRKARLAAAKLLPQFEDKSESDISFSPVNAKLPSLIIGCSGWFYWDWWGKFYPRSLPTKNWFDHYRKHFKTVELNAPFYSWPTIATVRTWIRQAKKSNFIYTVKVSELITHIKKFSGTKKLVKDFYFIGDLLEDKLGCFLFQLPPSFSYTSARLKQIVSQLDSKYRNVIEFRHKSWWNEKVYAALAEKSIIFCSVSGPKLPEELIKTAKEIYIRFHGTSKWYRHDYTNQELYAWVSKINQCNAERIWVYFNNDYDTYAIKNARKLIRLLKV